MLERKLIVNKTDQSGARQKEEITLRAAQPEDAPGIHRLMREAYNALTDKSQTQIGFGCLFFSNASLKHLTMRVHSFVVLPRLCKK